MATRWGILSGEAERERRKIPVLDGLLVATAQVGGLTFVTRDTRHLEKSGVPYLNPWG
ncbi:MAG: hypothetical protein ACE5JX_17775 [Acidobacteriota bacterium]